jgi:hypothetical protein
MDRFINQRDVYGHRGRIFVIDHACREHIQSPQQKLEFSEAIFHAIANGQVIYE